MKIWLCIPFVVIIGCIRILPSILLEYICNTSCILSNSEMYNTNNFWDGTVLALFGYLRDKDLDIDIHYNKRYSSCLMKQLKYDNQCLHLTAVTFIGIWCLLLLPSFIIISSVKYGYTIHRSHMDLGVRMFRFLCSCITIGILLFSILILSGAPWHFNTVLLSLLLFVNICFLPIWLISFQKWTRELPFLQAMLWNFTALLYCLGEGTIPNIDFTSTNILLQKAKLKSHKDRYLLPCRYSFIGLCIGCLPIPLDWNTIWQLWPVSPMIGCWIGFLIGSLLI